MAKKDVLSQNIFMKGAEPFEFKSRAPCAVLLIHGFTSSAHSMRELGEKLFQSGLDVKGMLLPGHGTTPEEMEIIKWTEWVQAVEYEYLQLRKSYTRVFVCGQSMGGCLTLYLSTFHELDGLVTIAAGLRLYGPALYLVPFVKTIYRFQKKHDGPDIKDPVAKENEVHYDRMPLRSIHELQKLLKQLRQRISKVEAPVLLIHAKEDHTVDFTNQQMIFDKIRSTVKKKIILENSYHVATVDYDKAVVQNETIHFLTSLCK